MAGTRYVLHAPPESAHYDAADHPRMNRAVIREGTRRLEGPRKLTAGRDAPGVPRAGVRCGRVSNRIGVGPGYGCADGNSYVVGSIRPVTERFRAGWNGNGRRWTAGI